MYTCSAHCDPLLILFMRCFVGEAWGGTSVSGERECSQVTFLISYPDCVVGVNVDSLRVEAFSLCEHVLVV